ncbi:MAG TPA: DUF1330 domain-containing protein [Acidimicrobiales bacterium]|nr:DUF1330 domain-containing protein [Acidimicrobiales bacterium]
MTPGPHDGHAGHDRTPGYLVVGLSPPEQAPVDAPERSARYGAGAAAALRRVGATMTYLARANPARALVGDWRHVQAVVEQYGSFTQILDFWSAPEYVAARPHRQGLVEIGWIVALPGRPLGAGDPAPDGSPPAAYALLAGPGAAATSRAGVLADVGPEEMAVLEGTWPWPGRVVVERHPSRTEAEAAVAGAGPGVELALVLNGVPPA